MDSDELIFQNILDETTIINDENIEEEIAKVFHKKKLTIAVAESVTAGGICKRLTRIPGSSEFFNGGIIAYTNRAKIVTLGISPAHLADFGPVSSETATAMAINVRTRLITDVGLSTTGVAGPNTIGNLPVGLVFIGFSFADRSICKKFNFSGSREEISERTATTALELLLLYLK